MLIRLYPSIMAAPSARDAWEFALEEGGFFSATVHRNKSIEQPVSYGKPVDDPQEPARRRYPRHMYRVRVYPKKELER